MNSRAVRGLAASGTFALLAFVASAAVAQPSPVPVQVVQGSDGTLYVEQGSNSWTLVPNQISDSAAAALNPIGEIDGTLPNELFAGRAPASPTVVVPVPVRVVQVGDGTLYVVQGTNSWTLVPDQASDSAVAALNPGGAIDGTFQNEFFVVQVPVAPPAAALAPAPDTARATTRCYQFGYDPGTLLLTFVIADLPAPTMQKTNMEYSPDPTHPFHNYTATYNLLNMPGNTVVYGVNPAYNRPGLELPDLPLPPNHPLQSLSISVTQYVFDEGVPANLRRNYPPNRSGVVFSATSQEGGVIVALSGPDTLFPSASIPATLPSIPWNHSNSPYTNTNASLGNQTGGNGLEVSRRGVEGGVGVAFSAGGAISSISSNCSSSAASAPE